MGVPFDSVESVVRAAARQFFEADDRVTAVGIGAHGRRFGLNVLRRAGGRNALPDRFRAVPVTVTGEPTTVDHAVGDVYVTSDGGTTSPWSTSMNPSLAQLGETLPAASTARPDTMNVPGDTGRSTENPSFTAGTRNS